MRQRRVSRPGTPPLPSPPPMTRVLIVDDDDLMRAGLRELLSNDPSIEIAGEASTGREAVERARRLAPDVVLMDVRMPDLDGIAATRELSRAVPGARVLILTTFEQDDYIFSSLRAGASGFLLKRTRPEELIEAVHTIAVGHSARHRPHVPATRSRSGRPGQAGGTHLTGTQGSRAHRPRPLQPRDRRRAHRRRIDYQNPCEAGPDEAQPARPRASRDLRLRERHQQSQRRR